MYAILQVTVTRSSSPAGNFVRTSTRVYCGDNKVRCVATLYITKAVLWRFAFVIPFFTSKPYSISSILPDDNLSLAFTPFFPLWDASLVKLSVELFLN